MSDMEKGLNYINELTWGYRASRILQVAVQLRIFTHLSEKSFTSEDLSSLCSAKNYLLEKVLIACSAMGLLKKEGDLYRNTELSEQYLVEGKSLYQGNIISHSANVWEFWNNLPNALLNEARREDPADSHRNFILGMHNVMMGGRGNLFIDNIDLSGRKKMFDAGGGPGTYCVLACQKYPELTATVFDLPETIVITKEILKKENMLGSISVQEGSWETDNFGEENDIVLLSNILHGSESQAEMKLKKAYQSLVSGGMVVIQEFLLDNSKAGSLIPALFNVMVGAYSQEELFAVIQKAGFSDVQLVINDEEIGCSWVKAVKS